MLEISFETVRAERNVSARALKPEFVALQTLEAQRKQRFGNHCGRHIFEAANSFRSQNPISGD